MHFISEPNQPNGRVVRKRAERKFVPGLHPDLVHRPVFDHFDRSTHGQTGRVEVEDHFHKPVGGVLGYGRRDNARHLLLVLLRLSRDSLDRFRADDQQHSSFELVHEEQEPLRVDIFRRVRFRFAGLPDHEQNLLQRRQSFDNFRRIFGRLLFAKHENVYSDAKR